MRRQRRATIALLTLLMATVLAACGMGPGTDGMAGMDINDGATAAADAPTAEATTADAMAGMDHTMPMGDSDAPYDVRFIDGMIIHHQGAIDMANQVLEQSQRTELRTLAQNIITAQTAEIQQLQAWRVAWFPGVQSTDGTGMAMGAMEISSDTSTPFDQRFIKAMIAHHQGAVTMARDAEQNAEHDEVKVLAQNIVTDQEAEIARMQQWQQEWFGE